MPADLSPGQTSSWLVDHHLPLTHSQEPHPPDTTSPRPLSPHCHTEAWGSSVKLRRHNYFVCISSSSSVLLVIVLWLPCISSVTPPEQSPALLLFFVYISFHGGLTYGNEYYIFAQVGPLVVVLQSLSYIPI